MLVVLSVLVLKDAPVVPIPKKGGHIAFAACQVRAREVSESSPEYISATPHLVHIDDLPNLGKYKDAQHRGPAWYDDNSDSEEDSEIIDSTSETEVESSDSSKHGGDRDDSSSASSFETKERKLATRVYRVCTPCPHDMMKKFRNIGIKWICGGYQRARRSFKSSCMMKYRNCEDGTMFVKLHNNRCKNDTYHGRHFFYIYRT